MKIEIQESYIKILGEKMEQSGEYKDIAEYVNFILGQICTKISSEKKKDENILKDRLKKLGYMN
jgi:hypothetical protein